MRTTSRLAGSAVLVVMLSGCIPHVGNSPAPTMAVGREGDELEMSYFPCDDELLLEVTVRRIDEVLGGGRVDGPILWQARSATGVATDGVVLGGTPDGFEVTVPLDGRLPLERELLVAMRTSRLESAEVDVFLPSDLAQDEVQAYFGEMPREEFETQDFDC